MILALLVQTSICINAAKIATTNKGVFFTTVYHPNPDHQDDKELKSFFKNQTKLVDHLFEDYNRNIPAIYTRDRYGDQPRPSLANISLYYMKLLSIDEPKQTSQMIIDVILTWVDPRLSWNPKEFNGIREFVIGKKETVWLPDILPYDIISYSESIPEDRLLLNVFSNGTISYYSTAVVEFICHLKLRNFPFDEQECEFRMTSFNAPTTELNVTGSISPEINDPSSVGNGEWKFQGVFVENDWYEGLNGRGYSMVIFHLAFRRSTAYYFMLVIIPSFILTLLSLTGLFWRSIEKDCYMENLNLGLTAILAMMLVMEISTENMPKIDEINKLSRYSMINLGLITLAILLNMILGKFHVFKKIKALKKELESMDQKPRLQLKYVFMKQLHIFFLILFNFVAVINLVILVF